MYHIVLCIVKYINTLKIYIKNIINIYVKGKFIIKLERIQLNYIIKFK